MPRNAHSYCSVQSNTKPPTDAPLTAVLPGINNLREQIHHNTDQSTSKVTVRSGRGDRTACKVTVSSHFGERRMSTWSSCPITEQDEGGKWRRSVPNHGRSWPVGSRDKFGGERQVAAERTTRHPGVNRRKPKFSQKVTSAPTEVSLTETLIPWLAPPVNH